MNKTTCDWEETTTATVLCVDCGLTKCKLLLFDQEGKCLGDEKFSMPIDNTLIDTILFRERLCAGMTRLLGGADCDPSDIICVSVSGHGNGLYAIGEDDVFPVGYSSMFARSASVIPAAGRTFPIINQSDWSGQPLPILTWLCHAEPQNYQKIKKFFFCKDLLRWFMTGVAVTEETDASAAGLLDYQTGRYNEELFQIYGLKDIQSKLPAVIKSDQKVCNVSEAFAKRTGLPAGIPVLGGLFDVNSCMLGSGAIDSGQYALIAGTWGINAAAVRTPVISRSITQCCRFFGLAPYVCIDSAPTSCVNLEWFTKEIMHGLSYEEADRITAAQPGDRDLIYLPYLYPPMDFPNARGGFIGLRACHDAKAMLRAVFEGIVLEHRYRVEKLRNAGIRADTAALSGGAASSAVFGQMFADVCGLDISIPEQAQAGALGGAVLGLTSMGIYPDIQTAAKLLARYKRSFHPDRHITPYYEEKYRQFCIAQKKCI